MNSTSPSVPPQRSNTLPSGLLLAIAILDLGWAAVGLLLTMMLVPLAVIAVIGTGIIAPETLEALATVWRKLEVHEQIRVVATGLQFLAAPALNLFLLVGALRLLRGRAGAVRCIRTWAIGVSASSVLDLLWIKSTWLAPWSWIAVAIVLVTPAWAIANLVLLSRPVLRAQLASRETAA